MSEPQTESTQSTAQPTWADNWRAAEAKVAALEGEGGEVTEQPADAQAPAAVPASEPENTEAADTKEDDESSSEGDRGAKVEALNKLASELGLKVDSRGVSVEERVGFRAEKREWHQKAKARDAEYAEKLQRTQQYFAPLGEAVEAIKGGDYDAAVRAIAKVAGDDDVAREGLNGATKRYLKRAAGEDPRIDALERELRERREREAQQERAQAEAEAARVQHERRQGFVAETAAELAKAEDEVLRRAAAKSVFAEQVVAEMERHWDGVETLSREEAAAEVVSQLRSAYKELQEIFGDLDPSTPEKSGDSSTASRSGKATVGKQKPKAHSARHAMEASPPGRSMSAEEWRQKWSRSLAASEE